MDELLSKYSFTQRADFASELEKLEAEGWCEDCDGPTQLKRCEGSRAFEDFLTALIDRLREP